MMKQALFFSCALLCAPVCAKDYLVNTPHTTLMVTADVGKSPLFQYYGPAVADAHDIISTGLAMNKPSYPAFGLHTEGEKAVTVQQPDGNMTLDLAVARVEETSDKEGRLLRIVMRDGLYPVEVVQVFKAYDKTDVITTWVEIQNNGRKPVKLLKYYSAFVPIPRGNNWMSHFHGAWASESMMEEEPLTNGQKVVANRNGLQNTHEDSPSLMISMSGPFSESYGHVLGATLAWPGNYKLKVDAKNTSLSLIAGISEEESAYQLDSRQTFVTPEFCMTFSLEGKGGVSRAFHRWARLYKLNQGMVPRDILLNSWEGIYFTSNPQLLR